MTYLHTELSEYVEKLKDKKVVFTIQRLDHLEGTAAIMVNFFMNKIESLEDEIKKLKQQHETVFSDHNI